MRDINFERKEHVAVVAMGQGENRFNMDFFFYFNQLLDQLEGDNRVTVMVLKSADPKVWSNGIDLNWLMEAIGEDPEIGNRFMLEMNLFLQRILNLPLITVAAITGHAFGGGAFLSFAHDFRFMRSDRGWLCMPEVDLGLTLGPVFMALSKKALSNHILEEMQFTGVRLTGEQCMEKHVVSMACPMESLMDEVMAFSLKLNKNRDIIAKMKAETHKETNRQINAAIAELRGV